MAWRSLRPVLVKGAVVLVIVLAAVEIGVRVLPPDTVQYQIQDYSNNESDTPTITSGTITDPVTIAKWRAAMTATPTGRRLVEVVIANQQDQIVCNSGSLEVTASYVFEWHGLPLESVAALPVCTEDYWISSGGLPDLGTYRAPILPRGQQ